MNDGTLSEPKGIPDPRFALPSSVHWMQALSMLVTHKNLNFQTALPSYKNVQKGSLSLQAENTVLEHLLLALHQLSALKSLSSSPNKSDITRVASVGWYYGIYDAATAMIAAQTGNLQDNHTQTARSWDNQFVLRSIALYPFDFRLSTLVKGDAETELDAYRRIGKTKLVAPPNTIDEAHDYACAYLSGSRSWWAWRAEEELKKTQEFRALGVTNFRTKAAREMRDNRLSRQAISFIHLAFRYRGKANYREALYLAHGSSVKAITMNFVDYMTIVLESFLSMAGAFVRMRLGKDLWVNFIDDVETNRAFQTSPKTVWT